VGACGTSKAFLENAVASLAGCPENAAIADCPCGAGSSSHRLVSSSARIECCSLPPCVHLCGCGSFHRERERAHGKSCRRKEKMSRNVAIAQRILPETEEQDLDEMIDVYLRYTRPENTRCRDYRLGILTLRSPTFKMSLPPPLPRTDGGTRDRGYPQNFDAF